MAQIGKEIKKTFSQFSNAFKNTDTESLNTQTSSSTTTAVANDTEVEKYRRTLNKAEQDISGRAVSSVGQKNKPRRALVINESPTVSVLEMTEKNDAYLAIEEIRNQQTIFVKLDTVDPEVRKSILDIIYGACHYANISIEKVASQIILIDPKLKK